MEIQSWSAQVKFIANLGGDSCTQTLEIKGGRTARDKFAGDVATSIDRSLALLGDASELAKRITQLEQEKDALKRQLSLAQEADDAYKAKSADHEVAASPGDLPAIAQETPRRGRPRKSE